MVRVERRSARAGEVLPQGDDGEQGDDADHDDGRLDHAGHDEPEGQGLVDSFDDREDRDGAADAGQGVDEVEEARPQHLGVVAGADDVAGVVQDGVEQQQRGDGGGEGQQVEDAAGSGVAAAVVAGGVGRGVPVAVREWSWWSCQSPVGLCGWWVEWFPVRCRVRRGRPRSGAGRCRGAWPAARGVRTGRRRGRGGRWCRRCRA